MTTTQARTDTSGWTLDRTVARQAARFGERVFLRCPGTGELTFAGLDRDATRIANALIGLGIEPGDTVLAMLPNVPAFVQAWAGIARAGAALVPVNTGLRGGFLSHVVNDSGARVMLVADRFLPQVAQVAGDLAHLATLVVLDDGGDGEAVPRGLALVRFDELLSGSADSVGRAVGVGDIGGVLYTSGTTGVSKGVLLPHGHMYINGHLMVEHYRVTPDDTLYCALPLFHGNGLTLQTYGALIAGASLVMPRQFSASRWIDDIREHGATITNLLGAMVEFVHRQPVRPDDGDNRLRLINAVPISEEWARDLERRFGVELVELYGTTELNCPIYTSPGRRRPGSCGRLVAEWYEARIVDPATDEEVPDGEVGELVVRPTRPSVMMAGYKGRPDATVAAWRNFWFHTGDAMRRDADGWYYFVDRMKDRIRHRGENVSAWEVEQALLAHPAVAEVSVIGVPTDLRDREQDVMACVVPAEDAGWDPAALLAFARDAMPKYAVPRYWRRMDALPKTPTHKVQREVLRGHGVTEETWDREADPATATRRRSA